MVVKILFILAMVGWAITFLPAMAPFPSLRRIFPFGAVLMLGIAIYLPQIAG